MSKINIKAILNNLTDNEVFNTDVKGIYADNKIKYIDNSVTTILELKDDQILLERVSNEYYVHMIFDKENTTNGIYKINNLGFFDIRIETRKLEVKDNNINIKYSMYIDNVKQDFEYKIIYEE